MTDINEDLRKWFKEKWVRFDTKGKIKGDCAKEPGEGKPKCLPRAEAHALGEKRRASAARRKRREDPNAERKGKAKFVKTHNEEVLLEKNVPTNPKLWAQAKAQAKKKFKIYPCVPMDSQAITREGLKSFDELSIGEEILTYNINKDVLEWGPITNLHFYENAPLKKIYKSTGFCIKATENHKWVVKTGTAYDQVSLVETKDIHKRMRIVTGAVLENEENKFLEENWSKKDNWVSKVLSWSKETREVFLASSIIYDGHDVGGSSKIKDRHTFGFTQKNDDHFWSALFAAYLNGYHISFYEKTESISGASIIRNKKYHNTQNLIIEDAGSEDVWCPTTENQTWVMVQNGFITITGNSAYANGWAAKWYKSKGGGWKSLNEDYEHEMARNELRTAMRGIERLMKHLDGEGELEAWVQSKLTKAADYIDTLADYMDSRDETVKEAYELIEEAKKKMDKKTIPQTVQMMTPGSNPYADDSTSPSYVSTPGQAITEARRSLKGEYKRLSSVKGPKAARERELLRTLAAARKRKASEKKAEKQPDPPMKPKEDTPRERIASAFNRPGYTSKPEETKKETGPTSPFWAYVKDIKKSGEQYNPKKGKQLIKAEYKEAKSNIQPNDQFGWLKRHSAEESYLKQMQHHRDLKNSIVHRLLKGIGLREEGGAGDMGTTELTKNYIEHTPGQLPIDDKKKKITDTIKQTIKEEVLCEAVPRIGAGQTTRRTVRFQEKKRSAPPGRKVTIKRPTAKHNVATRGPGPIRKPRPGSTVAGGIRNTAKFVKAATKSRRMSQVSMRNRQNARRTLTMSARG
jgi:hypothetical protein